MLQQLAPRAFVPILAATCTATAQVAWTNVSAVQSPNPRASATATFDTVRGVAVLFGGNDPWTSFSDTWELDATGWTNRANVGGPSPRSRHGFTFDSTTGASILFGGWRRYPTELYRGDTWSYDGTAWTQVTTTGPSPRGAVAMAYDSTRNEVVLFGGFDGTSYFADTWLFDGSSWTQTTPTNAPAPRAWAAMGFDENASEMVLFGGTDDTTSFNDTWIWNGTNWTQFQPQTTPPARASHGIVYDRARDRIVMFGGNGATALPSPSIPLDDIWELDSTNWVLRTPQSTPPARLGQSLAYDIHRHMVVAFGGSNGPGHRFGDTWKYAPINPATTTPFGSGCAGSAGTPVLAPLGSSLPWLGESVSLQLDPIPQTILNVPFMIASVAALPTPLELSFLGMPGCELLIALETVNQLTNVGGSATWTLAVPANTALVGLPVYAQGFVLDFTANQFGAVVSNGVELTIGSK